MDIIESIVYHRASGLASDLSRSPLAPLRRSAAPRRTGAGGDAAEVVEELRRRLAIGPELAELVAEAVEDDEDLGDDAQGPLSFRLGEAE